MTLCKSSLIFGLVCTMSTMSDTEFQSNRSVTSPFSTLQLLYYNSYISSGLLPPPMQTTELCELWCLFKGEANPFKVIANVGGDIYELKKLIKGEKVELRSVDASDLVLWKVRMFQWLTYTFHSRWVARQSSWNRPCRDPFRSSSAILLRVFRQHETAYAYHLKLLSPRFSQGLSTYYRGMPNQWVRIDQVSR